MTIRIVFIFFIYISLIGQNLEADDFSYSLKLYNQGYYDLAIRAFKTFNKNYPKSKQKADAIFYLGQASRKEKDLSGAKDYYKKLALDFPNHQRAALGWLLYGEILMEEKKYDESAKSLENVKLLYPNSEFVAEAIFKAANAYDLAKNFDKSEFLYRTIILEYKSTSFYDNARLSLISILGRSGKIEEQKLLISKYKNDARIKNKVLFEEARILFNENDYQEAKIILDKLTVNLKGDWKAKAQVLLGEILQRTHNYKKAEQLFKSVSLAVNDDYRKERLADNYYLQSEYQKAANIYSGLDREINMFKLALSFKHLGLNSKAIDVLEKLNKRKGEFYIRDYAILLEADLLWKQKETIRLIDFIKKYETELKSKHHSYFLAKIKAQFYESRLEYDLALNLYNRLLMTDPFNNENDDLLYRKAILLNKSNRLKEARDVLSELMNDYPNSKYIDSVSKMMNDLKTGASSESDIILKEISALLSKMILNEDKAAQLISLGKIQYFQLRDYKSAINHFLKAEKFAKKTIDKNEAKLYTGLSYIRLADLDNDSSHYNEAKNLFADILESSEDREHRFEASKGLIESQLANISDFKVKRTKAIKYYNSLINGNKEHKNIDFIRVKLAEYLIAEKSYEQSLDVLNEISNQNLVKEKLSLSADTYIKKDSLPAAADALKELITSGIDGILYYKTIIRLIPIEEKLGRLDNAMAFRELLLKQFPKVDLADHRNKLLQYYLDKGRLAEAESLMKKKKSELLTNDLVLIKEYELVSHLDLLQYAKLYDLKDQDHLALKFYYEFLRYNKDLSLNNDVLLSVAEIHLEDNNNERAIQSFEKISSDYSNYGHVKKSLMVLYYKEDNFSKVISIGKDVLAENKSSDSFQELKKIYMIAGINSSGKINFKNELKSYKKQYPKDLEGQAKLILEYAKSERKRKNYDRSIKLLEDIVDDYEKTSLSDDAAYYRVLNLFTLNLIEKAMESINEFIEVYPNSELLGDVYNTMGAIFVRATKYENAIDAYRKTLLNTKKEETKKIAYSSLVNVYKNVGLWEPILTTAGTFIQLYPTDINVLDFKILIGQAYSNLGRGSEAISYLKSLKLEADRDREPEIQYAIADTYYKMKDFNNAVTEFIKIPLLSKKTKLQWVPSALYYAGKSYESLGKFEDAIKMYKEIIDRPGIDALFKKEAKKQINRLSVKQ